MGLLPEFMPMDRKAMEALGWDSLDVLLVSGDAYVDHPSFGPAVIGRLLLSLGYKVGIIAQPDWRNPDSLKVMGRPNIACGVTAGNMDSMVCLYTVGRRLRRDDCYSPGGKTGLKPPHATVVYSQLAKAAFPGIPVVLGGVEASLRRVAHYDYWQDKMRPSLLVDSKAEIIVYGMGERAATEIFKRLAAKQPLDGIKGTARLLGGKASAEFKIDNSVLELPDFETMLAEKSALMKETITIESEMNPWTGKRLVQRYGQRLLVVEPPAEPLTSPEFDNVSELGYAWRPHPSYREPIPAFETIKASIPAVRGCPGGCSFCGLVSHQGRFVISRSEESVIRDAKRLCERKGFSGTITDVGGAAGNIYGHGPRDPERCKVCKRYSCIVPSQCPNYNPEGSHLIKLLRRLKGLPGIKNVFINSGVRLDLALLQPELTREIIAKHVSGHLKVAPEHLHPEVLKLMRKGKADEFPKFMEIFDRESHAAGKEQYLIPLFISNFPGCGEEEMKVVDKFLADHNWSPQQAQDYIPLPMTMGAAMYYCGTASDGTPIEVNRGLKERRTQLDMLKRDRSHCTGGQKQPWHGNKDKKHNGPPQGKWRKGR